MISIIVAMDENRLIGNNNQLPWRLPADLHYFKKVTLNKPIIMGRKTWDSLPGILPKRRHIVITRNPSQLTAQGFDVAGSILEAIKLVRDAPEVLIIGGASIIEQSFALAERLYITKIHHQFDGDCWLPEYDQTQWQEVSKEAHKADDKNPYDYDFIVYKKIATLPPG